MHIIHIIESTATGTLSMVELLANHQVKTHDVTVIYSVRADTPAGLAEMFDDKVQLKFVDMTVVNPFKALIRF